MKTPNKAYSIAFAGPILPGKEEPWRRFLQELAGSRSQEYATLKRRLGILTEWVWLMRTRDSMTVIACFEAQDPQQALMQLVASEEPFDSWFKEKLREFHGYDLTRLREGWYPELVFALGGHRPYGTGPQARRDWSRVRRGRCQRRARLCTPVAGEEKRMKRILESDR